MREHKEKRMLPRADIAGRLRRIADQLEQGVGTEGGLHLSMPDLAEFELEVEPDELEIKIEWR